MAFVYGLVSCLDSWGGLSLWVGLRLWTCLGPWGGFGLWPMSEGFNVMCRPMEWPKYVAWPTSMDFTRPMGWPTSVGLPMSMGFFHV